ncbi:hypothetical protein [Dawidia soli]|uniref:Uncharacterized protein n=1 Tax=Dawidia soli TaxID=2782352 RepID=A0AAP2GGF9_9BACT|nr:hypothetical protein [Dawidia soli]MBT1685460.1 hypothetical protein [Dawidia soli]
MKEQQEAAFNALFREACAKCLGQVAHAPLTEADARLLSIDIHEQTGLTIGVKSLRNYSLYILGHKEGKKENPSVATRDTLARYVLGAPYTDEVQRKDHEGHHPYWFRYKSRFQVSTAGSPETTLPGLPRHRRRRLEIRWVTGMIILLLLITSVWALRPWFTRGETKTVTEHFTFVQTDSLSGRGWILENPDTAWWSKRADRAGHLALYTLPGDNWSTGNGSTSITNLLYRTIPTGCFTTEIHLTGFFPVHNWQQVGILLAENKTFTGKVLRLSIGYNSFFGGYDKPAEIMLQAMSSSGSGDLSKPEEIAHVTLFTLEPEQEILAKNNLARTALKIERHGHHYRFLFAIGSMEGFAFKEAAHGDFTINPRYMGLFAIQGTAPPAPPVPAWIDSYHFASIHCDNP